MEEVQKNENGTTVPQADGKPKKEDKPKRELTPQQVQQRRKMIVFPLMFLAFAGCMYLIFAPSGKEDVNVESVGGFNADIPLPAEDGIIADKQKAYEQAVTSRKQQDKIQSLQDFGFTLDDDTEEPQEEINLMPEEDPKPQRGGGASSRAAYRDINRQLSTFYETPPVDEEKEELKRQVAELTDLPGDTPVSMNLWGFGKSFLDEAENRFAAWLDANLPTNPLKCEYFLPLVVTELIEEGKAKIQVLRSTDKWYGVTYREDKPLVVEAIARKTAEGQYPENLWA